MRSDRFRWSQKRHRETIKRLDAAAAANCLNSDTTSPITMKFHTSPEEETSSPMTHDPSTPAFSYRSYQKDDLARAALRDGCILGWDPGMGKTMAIFTLPFLKNARFALIVAPGGLHEQIIDEGREKFGVTVTPLPDQETALRFMREGVLPLPGSQGTGHGSRVTGEDASHTSSPINSSTHDSPPATHDTPEPAFFITSYTALGYNGADEWHVKETNDFIRSRRLTMLRHTVAFPDTELANRIAAADWKAEDRISDWEALSLPENATDMQVRTALRCAAILFHPIVRGDDPVCHWRFQRILNAAQSLLHLSAPAMDKLEAALATDPALMTAHAALAACELGIGTERTYSSSGILPLDSGLSSPPAIKCVFRPTLASLVTGIFDFVVCDEAVRIKSGSAYQAQGVLRMTGRYRYALTGTAIKNRLPDFFFLASWVTGHTEDAIARWPYGNKMEDRAQFGQDFGVTEENLTAAEQALENGKVKPRPKTTAQICNVHRLWRVIGPVFIGRKKDDVPECDLVNKTVVPIRVMPGKEQQRVYQYHLHHRPEKKSALASIGTQLQYLRQAALNPGTAALPAGKNSRSTSPWTPKHIGILQLATDLLAQGEQLVIFSPFCDFSAGLANRLTEAGVPHLKLDGTTSPKKRGSLIKEFKSGKFPILIAGINSMGEGHSLDNCCHLVLPSLDWEDDVNSQAVERVHRLTSKKDVTIYVMVTKGTIDERLTSLWQEKRDSSDLALYGRLSTQDREEIDLGQLLRDAVADFNPRAETLDESEVSDQWQSTIRPALTASMASYRKLRPLQTSNIERPTSNIQQKTSDSSLSSTSTSDVQCSTFDVPKKPRTLFDLMNQKRNQQQPPAASTSLPSTFDVGRSTFDVPPPQAVQPLRNIIPFPGRLAAATHKKPVATLNLAR